MNNRIKKHLQPEKGTKTQKRKGKKKAKVHNQDDFIFVYDEKYDCTYRINKPKGGLIVLIEEEHGDSGNKSEDIVDDDGNINYPGLAFGLGEEGGIPIAILVCGNGNYSQPSKNLNLFIYESIGGVFRDTDYRQFLRMLSWNRHGMNIHTEYFGRNLPTWEAVKKAVDEPWTEGLEAVEKFLRLLDKVQLPELKSHIRKPRFNEDMGDELDYDRLRSGQPYWRESQREIRTGPTTVTVFSDLSTAWYHTPTDVLWRGAASIALTSKLEQYGYRTELWSVEGTKLTSGLRDDRKYIIATCLKKTGDPVDAGSLIKGLSAWYYRAVVLNRGCTAASKLGHEMDRTGYVNIPTQTELDEISKDKLRVFIKGVHDFDGAAEIMVEELKRISTYQE